MSKGKREQTRNAESVVNTRQDRNTFITDGGTWTWDASAGTLAWSAAVNIQRGGVANHTVAAGSVTGLTSAGHVAFVDVDRAAGGAVIVEGGATPGPLTALTATSNNTDERVVLGVRGSDSKFYLRDGTIFSDGDSKTLGTLNSVTDRGDLAATGATTETVPFAYVLASNQLAVYVGGMLMELGVHYTETDPTTITWTTLGQPLAGERISFLNIVGGQGPAGGSGDLQSAFNNGGMIDTTASLSGVRIYHSSGGSAFSVDDAPSGAPNLRIFGTGAVAINSGTAGYLFRDNASGNSWAHLPLDDGSGDAIFINNGTGQGFRVDKWTGAIEHGSYVGAYPGGTWTPEGSGGLKWAVYTGSIDAGGADEIIATGLTGIIGVVLSVDDGNRGDTSVLDMANVAFTNKVIAATFNGGTGDVKLSGNLNLSALIGSHLRGEAYTVIVFYQG